MQDHHKLRKTDTSHARRPAYGFLLVALEMVEGDRPHGRPVRRWSDDVTDWCGCTLPEAVRLATDREEWRSITGINGPHGSWVQKKTLWAGTLPVEVLSSSVVWCDDMIIDRQSRRDMVSLGRGAEGSVKTTRNENMQNNLLFKYMPIFGVNVA